MVHGFGPGPGGLDEDLQVFAGLGLADEIVQNLRAQAGIGGKVVFHDFRLDHAFVGHALGSPPLIIGGQFGQSGANQGFQGQPFFPLGGATDGAQGLRR